MFASVATVTDGVFSVVMIFAGVVVPFAKLTARSRIVVGAPRLMKVELSGLMLSPN